jgi:SAM-dependent methyltransferase
MALTRVNAPRAPWRVPPAVEALLIQVGACLLLAALLMLSRQLLSSLRLPLFAAIGLQGLGAALMSRWRGQAAWWPWMHLAFLPLLAGALALHLPPALFLGGFILLVLLYWSTFRTQVPLYLSGAAARDAVAAALPAAPLRFIDIGSGLGGMVLDLASRRPDSVFEGIELAPLPWLASRARQAIGGRGRFLRGDYERLDFSQYDVVFAYLSPAAMPRLWQKARAEMRPGALLLSHEFIIPGLAADLEIPTGRGGKMLYGWTMRKEMERA